MSALKPCNINITEALLENVYGIGEGVRWLTKANDIEDRGGMARLARSEFSFYKIINHTGMPLLYWTEDGSRHLLKENGQAPLHFTSIIKSNEDQNELSTITRTMMINVLDDVEAEEYFEEVETKNLVLLAGIARQM